MPDHITLKYDISSPIFLLLFVLIYFLSGRELVIIFRLLASGLTEFQVELGEADFFRGLIEEADIEEEIEWKLRELIENKNYFGVELINYYIFLPSQSYHLFHKYNL